MKANYITPAMESLSEFMFNSYDQEQFREHPTHKGIFVGNRGTILSTRKKGMPYRGVSMNPYGNEPREVKPTVCCGYQTICLRNTGKGNSVSVHRLVAEVWIPNPDNLPCINHKDEDKLNNSIDNLEWCTYSYNINYGSRNAKVASALRRRPRSQEVRDRISQSKRGKKLVLWEDGKRHFRDVE